MLYSEADDRLVLVVDKGSLSQDSIPDLVNGFYSSIKTRQAIKVAKQEIAFHELIQELVEPKCKIKQTYLEGDLVHDDTYYFEMAAFELQGTNFLVPMHQFIQKTDQFSVVFGSAFRTAGTPSRFPGVTANDFRSLMKCLYPLPRDTELSTDDWVSILKLSTKWRMRTLREEAIRKLSSEPLSGIAKVQLGTECMIAEWVRSGFVTLLEREAHFTEAEAIAIGLDNVTKLCQLREQRYAGEWDTYRSRFTLEAHGTSNLIANKVSRIDAVKHTDYENVDLVTAILDAQSLGNRTMMMDAWGRTAKRLESLTLEEVERLTLGIAIMMWEVRLETRRAAWSLVQDYGAKCDVKALDATKSIATAFASELQKIDTEALNYTSIKPTTQANKGKKPATHARGDRQEVEEIPESTLEATPQGKTLLNKSLQLRREIRGLEQQLNGSIDATLATRLQKNLKRCRLTAQKWCTSAVGSSTPKTVLALHATNDTTLIPTIRDMMAKLVLKNAGRLILDGRQVGDNRWHSVKSILQNWIVAAQLQIEIRIVDITRDIFIILPVSES